MYAFGIPKTLWKLADFLRSVATLGLMLGCTTAMNSDEESLQDAQTPSSMSNVDPVGPLIEFEGIPTGFPSTTRVIVEISDIVSGHLSEITTTIGQARFELAQSTWNTPSLIRAYLDLNGSGKIERCPRPAQNGQRILSEDLDLWVAETLITTARDEVVPLRFDFRLCGAGETNTKWVGQVDLSQSPRRSNTKLLAELKSLHDSDEERFETILDVTDQLMGGTDIIEVHIGALLHGRHELRFFWDNDADLMYSPCLDSEIGGGDLGASNIISFESRLNETVQPPTAVSLTPTSCSALSNHIVGQVVFPTYSEAEENRHEGTLILEISDDLTGALLYRRTLQHRFPLPTNFLVSNLPSRQIRIRTFLDRDQSQTLESCAEIEGGQDLVSSPTKTVALNSSDEVLIGNLVLEEHACDIDLLSQARFQVAIAPPGARKESPRPVYLSVLNQESGRSDFLDITENHLSLIQPTTITQSLEPGSYSAFAFVDTEQDMLFSDCEFDAFADRARSALIEFQVSQYQLLDVPLFQIERLGCDFPTVQFNLNVDLSITEAEVSNTRIFISLVEGGGLTESFVFDVPQVAPPWFFPISDLVPGTYEVSVLVSGNNNTTFEGCEGREGTQLAASTNITLDRHEPVLDATINLADPCTEQ